MPQVDLLEAVLRGVDVTGRDEPVVVPESGWRGGWAASSGSWLADRDRQDEGDQQNTFVPHLRTGDANGRVGASRYHRTFFWRSFAAPLDVFVSFRVESYDADASDTDGFKLTLAHQDTLIGYHLSFRRTGRVLLFREERDGVYERDGRNGDYGGVNIGAEGEWDATPLIRHHLHASIDREGRIVARIDGEEVLTATDDVPILSGQVAFRLDRTDTTIHSLVVAT